jgi:hypothetical protein
MSAAVPRVLVVTDEPVGPRMAGRAIRAWELARVLGRTFPTTLAAPAPVPANAPGFALTAIPTGPEGDLALAGLVAVNDIVVARTLPLTAIPTESMATKYLVVDLACPWQIEDLEAHSADAATDEAALAGDLMLLDALLAAGDFFICANEAQRGFWLGALAQTGRLTPAAYGPAHDARPLIDLVPSGVPAEPPQKTARTLKGVVPGIGQNDVVALWGGGLWRWLDPLTFVRAMGRLKEADYPVRAVFLGAEPPGAAATRPSLTAAARSLSDERGLTGTHVFFLEGWAPYAERANFLLEADIGVSLHPQTLETRFAYRMRVLDYLWAGIVPVVSDGDTMADLVRTYDAGRVVPPGDDAALAEARQALCDDPYARRLLGARAHALGQSFTWETVAEPLIAFCRAPRKGARIPGLTAAELQERITEQESQLYQTRTYAERLERELAARGGPDLSAPAHTDQRLGNRFRRAVQGLRRGIGGAGGTDNGEENPPASG